MSDLPCSKNVTGGPQLLESSRNGVKHQWGREMHSKGGGLWGGSAMGCVLFVWCKRSSFFFPSGFLKSSLMPIVYLFFCCVCLGEVEERGVLGYYLYHRGLDQVLMAGSHLSFTTTNRFAKLHADHFCDNLIDNLGKKTKNCLNYFKL